MSMVKLSLIVLLAIASASADCPNGYIRHDDSCYKFFSSMPSTWAEAMSLCEIFGSRLAIIESNEEQLFIEGLLRREYQRGFPDGVWLDGTDGLRQGHWIWANTGDEIITGESYTKWFPGEPNSAERSGEHCLDLLHHENYNWNDDNCAEKMDFLCEMPLTENIAIGK